jgi:diguanylate cyclase (GGDEF)-like protein
VASLGVHRLLGRGLWRAYTQREGLPDQQIWTITRDQDASLLVGTDLGLVRGSGKSWLTMAGTENNVVRTVQRTADGTLFLGGIPVEVIRWNPRSRQVDGRFGAESGLNGKRIFRLVLDPEGTLWVATEGGGLQKAKASVSGPMRFESVILPGGNDREYVSGLTLGASGRLMACGEKGLAVLEKGQWRRFTAQDGLLRTHVAYAVEARNGDVVVAYFEALGFSRLRLQEGTLQVVQHLEDKHPVSREKVYMLGEDSKSRIWVGTGQGVFVLDGERIERFGLAEGLVGDDISNMAFLSDPGGDVWIGTSAGLARFDAGSYRGQPAPPPSVVLSYQLGGKRYFPGVDPEPNVPHGSNTFDVSFAGLSFLGEGYVQHQIRLRDLETDWHPTQSREARYPALSAGRYIFDIRSRIGEGAWGPETAIAFVVHPAWWGTWWFRGLLVLVGGGSLYLVLLWRMKALRRKNRQLEDLVAARTRELEVANEALRSQSLTDPLTGLKNRRFLGVSMPDDVAHVNRAHRKIAGSTADRQALNIDLIFIMVDVDHFKSVNDAYGHHAGDLVLQRLADILRTATRDTDTVVRWGGEEFLVVARNASRKDGAILVERIRSQVEACAFDIGGGQTLKRTCSLGFSFFPFLSEHPTFMPWEMAVDIADHCLYAAKRGGRNAWVGLAAPFDAIPQAIGENPTLHIPELLKKGALELKTSLPEAKVLDWELKL